MNDKTDEKRKLDQMTAEFLARGGAVTRHPPGESKNIVYKYGRGRMGRKAATPETGKPEE